ncbi:MAG TPA: PIG-L deacetylase family protein [Phototrophicaceae bacterium]|nr:PIG-L deacetylase family protein [Phototrophicaceae bacterium]
MTDTIQQPKRIMVVFAHPDDPEFFCGGTLARWSAEGAQITFVLATSGDKGSDDPEMTPERLITLREEEERRAAAVLGVKDIVFLRYRDGDVQPTPELKRDIVRLMRLRKPDILVTNDPTTWWNLFNRLNHPDHRHIGEAALEAVFPAVGNRMFFPELEQDEGLPPHKIPQVWLAITREPNTKVDVTDYLETRLNALREHRSQIKDMDALEQRLRANVDPEAPPGQPRYLEQFRVLNL